MFRRKFLSVVAGLIPVTSFLRRWSSASTSGDIPAAKAKVACQSVAGEEFAPDVWREHMESLIAAQLPDVVFGPVATVLADGSEPRMIYACFEVEDMGTTQADPALIDRHLAGVVSPVVDWLGSRATQFGERTLRCKIFHFESIRVLNLFPNSVRCLVACEPVSLPTPGMR